MNDLTVARIARRAAVCAEFLALKARRCMAEQTTENTDDMFMALRSAYDNIVGIFCQQQADEGPTQMPKFYEIKGRVAISGNPMTDAKLLARFQAEYDALAAKFTETGGSLDMRIMMEKEKAAATGKPTLKAAE
jgi:hypothetical protein